MASTQHTNSISTFAMLGNGALIIFSSPCHLSCDARLGVQDLVVLLGEPPVESPAPAPPAAGCAAVVWPVLAAAADPPITQRAEQPRQTCRTLRRCWITFHFQSEVDAIAAHKQLSDALRKAVKLEWP